MTAWRIYQKEPITPDQALLFILQNSGNIFDPFVVKVFIHAMGLYPVGTIVELEDGALVDYPDCNYTGYVAEQAQRELRRAGGLALTR
jgi:HD-GYP domain-containing protein (c-di-GMP phosphodiesterase class II)